MPDFNGRKTGLIIPNWEAKRCFHGMEYAERERKGVLEDRDFWDPGGWEIIPGADKSPQFGLILAKEPCSDLTGFDLPAKTCG
jgi:hypothetical protein